MHKLKEIAVAFSKHLHPEGVALICPAIRVGQYSSLANSIFLSLQFNIWRQQ